MLVAASVVPISHLVTTNSTPSAVSLFWGAARSLKGNSPQIAAVYDAHKVVFRGAGISFSVGTPSLGREALMNPSSFVLEHRTRGAIYQNGNAVETFFPSSSGIEQSFRIARRPLGRGSLEISLPLTGVRAEAAAGGRSVHLVDRAGQVRAEYSRLRVTDARGRRVRADLRASGGGGAITVTIHDRHARYPLMVDPTWSENAEVINLGANSVSLDSTTAVVGVPSRHAAYVYTYSNSAWSLSATLTPSDPALAGANFGSAVAISGTRIVVGSPGATPAGFSGLGTVYTYTLSGSTWSQTSELGDNNAGGNFAAHLTLANNLLAVSDTANVNGAYSGHGIVYTYYLSGSSWTSSTTLSDANVTTGSNFGVSLSINPTSSPATIAVGEPGGDNSSSYGQVFLWNWVSASATWRAASPTSVSDPGTQVGDAFGASTTMVGNYLAVGAPNATVGANAQQGAEYIFYNNGLSWSFAQTLTATDGVAQSVYGTSSGLTGTVLLVGAPGLGTMSGKVYQYDLNYTTWQLGQELGPTDSAPSDTFGQSIGFARSTAVVGETPPTGGPAGNVYFYDGLPRVIPQGVIPGPDTFGGGSPSIPSMASAEHVVGYGVNTATGDMFQTTTDLSLPGAGPALAFTRTYDAQAAQAEGTVAGTAPALGYGWADSFGASLSFNATTQIATVTEENGAQLTFHVYPSTPAPDPGWCANSTVNFCATSPRVQATLNLNVDGTYTFNRLTTSPIIYTFSATGALISIADRQGNTITPATYAPTGGQTACPASTTCVAWTNSASGRELVLATNTSGQLTSVFDANSSLAATFTYSGTGCSTWTSTPSDLCTSSDPGGILDRYTYDSSNSAVAFRYDVLSALEPGTSSATSFTFDTQGRITQQSDPLGRTINLAYSGTNSTATGGTTTVTTYPQGASGPQAVTTDTYSSNVLNGQANALGSASATIDNASLFPMSVTDADNHVTPFTYQSWSGPGGTVSSSSNVLTAVDPLGDTVAHAYNPFNQPWCTVDAADYANGVRCPANEPSSPPAPGAADPYPGVAYDVYNAADELTSSTDALGNTTIYAYTSGIAGVPNGLLYCSVDPANYRKSVTCPAYGAAHVTGTTTYTFDAAGDVTAMTDSLGNTTTNAYGFASTHPGMVSSSTGPDGTVTSFSYNGASETTSMMTAFASYSETTTTAYDSYGRAYCTVSALEYSLGVTCPASPPSSPPTPPSDPYLGTTITTFDAAGETVQSTNPIGGVTYYGFDNAGEPYCTVAPVQAKAGVTCPGLGFTTPTPSSDPYLGATLTQYGTSRQVTQVTSALGGITLSTYDAKGQVLTTTVESSNATSAPNVVTTFTYDAAGRKLTSTVASGSLASTTNYAYDPNGHAFCTVSPAAYAAGSSTYQCPTWRPAWVSAVPSPSALYSTTPSASQANNVTTAFFDANGNQVQTTNPDVQTSVTAVDGDGRVYCSLDAVNLASYLAAHPSASYPYLCPTTPPTSPPATGSNPGYSTTIYDAAGNVASSTNQLGDTTAYTYEPGGGVLTTTDPRGMVTTNCYYWQNATGQCAHAAPASGGAAEDLYSTTTPATAADPSGAVTTRTYLPGDAVHSTTSPAVTTTFAYDGNGDQTSVTYSAVQPGYATPANVTRTYNVDGTVRTVADATGTTTYAFDAGGDVTSQSLAATSPLANSTVAYFYFSTGKLASIVYPSYNGHTNPTATYTYDATGAMATVKDWLSNTTTFAHDANGSVTFQAATGGASMATTYDHTGQVSLTTLTGVANTGCQSGTPSVTQSFSGSTGSRNANGQVTQFQIAYANLCTSTYQRNYSYDLAGQVSYQGSAPQGASPATFTYDPSGDLTKITTHDAGGNFNGYTQSFDNTGAVTAQTPTGGGVASTFTYDTLGDHVSSTGVPAASYGFNALGQMTSFTGPAGTTTYLYNGNGLEASASLVATAQWASPLDANGSRATSAVACPAATLCLAVGPSGYATTWNGATWSTPVQVDSTRTMTAISCVSATFCVAVDSGGYALTWNGNSWSAPIQIDSTRSMTNVTCLSTTFCMAAGANDYVVLFNGSTWTATPVGSFTRSFTQLSCPSTTFCMAIDSNTASYQFNGSTWSTAVNLNTGINSLKCVSSTFCVTVGGGGSVDLFTGSWGAPANIDRMNNITSVSCVSSTFCEAVDASGNQIPFTGSWGTPTSIDGTRALNAVSCLSTTYCVAVGASGYAVAWNGTSWAAPVNNDATRSETGLGCIGTFCMAIDSSGYAVAYQQRNASLSQLTWGSTGQLPLVMSDGSSDYLYGPGTTPVEQIALGSSTPTFLFYNPSSGTWSAAGSTGAILSTWGYDAFGTSSFGISLSAFGFAGQYTDPSSGLSDLRARFYQPSTGSFTTVDPAFAATDSAYTYAGGDPVNTSDPTGLCVRTLSGACRTTKKKHKPTKGSSGGSSNGSSGGTSPGGVVTAIGGGAVVLGKVGIDLGGAYAEIGGEGGMSVAQFGAATVAGGGGTIIIGVILLVFGL